MSQENQLIRGPLCLKEMLLGLKELN